MIKDIAYFLILGQPLLLYMGILAFILILMAATVGRMNFKGITTIPFKWHPRLVILAISVTVIHMVLGLSIFLNF